MNKIAFYIMNSKGYYVLEKFINKFGRDYVDYIVCSEDKNIKKDFFEDIKILAQKEKIKFFNRFENYSAIENSFFGYKFAIGWRWLIKNEDNLIVFHDSLLPKYRGFAPLVNCLVNNEKICGVTALTASDKYDSGNIITQRSFEINYPIKINEVINKIEPFYFELLEEIFISIKNNKELKIIKQDEKEATYSLWLDSDDYLIDWSWSATKIKRFVDAVGYPYDNAKAYLNGKSVRFIDIELIEDVNIEHRERHIGKVIFIREGIIIVVCTTGLIGLKDVRDNEGNKIVVNFRSRFK
jgi:methionyl-tRNA formyltransferase